MSIGDRIKERRKELDMTAEDLAVEIGKSRATVYRYENGDIEDMPITVIEPLAAALKTTPDYLLGWDDDPNDYDSDDFSAVDARLFDGDVRKQIAFDEAVSADAMATPLEKTKPRTLAARFEGEEFTPEELAEIEQFVQFVKSKRK